MLDKIVRLSVNCKFKNKASKNLPNFVLFFVCQFLKANYETPLNFMEFFEEIWKTL